MAGCGRCLVTPFATVLVCHGSPSSRRTTRHRSRSRSLQPSDRPTRRGGVRRRRLWPAAVQPARFPSQSRFLHLSKPRKNDGHPHEQIVGGGQRCIARVAFVLPHLSGHISTHRQSWRVSSPAVLPTAHTTPSGRAGGDPGRRLQYRTASLLLLSSVLAYSSLTLSPLPEAEDATGGSGPGQEIVWGGGYVKVILFTVNRAMRSSFGVYPRPTS